MLIYRFTLSQYNKKEILEFYLNQEDFGNGIRGFPMAAKVKFGKDINTLNQEQQLELIRCATVSIACFSGY